MGKTQGEYYHYIAYSTNVNKENWRTKGWKMNITAKKGLIYFKWTINRKLFNFCLKIGEIMCHREEEKGTDKETIIFIYLTLTIFH
jgi:hypothetical protein